MNTIRSIYRVLLLFALGLVARDASAHGFELQQDNYFTAPTKFNITSNQPYLDNVPAPPDNAPPSTPSPTPAPAGWNVFTDEFDSSAAVDPYGISGGAASYGTYEGFVQQTNGWTVQSATFKILSPLYFSDGTGSAAQPAAAGTYLQFYDQIATGGSDPSINPADYPNASPLPTVANGLYVNLYGTTPSATGFPVSAEYFHELQKALYLGTLGSETQTYGEYGYAFDVTVTLVPTELALEFNSMLSPVTLTTAPMVDVFAMTDPEDGDFGDDALQSQQDMATEFIYEAATSAATAVPEPSTFAMAAVCVAVGGAVALRRRRARQFATVPRW